MGKHAWLDFKRWAVVGASPNPEKYGNKIVRALKDNGYDVYPVAPRYEEVEGIKAYPELGSIPEDIDVVDFVVNPKVGMIVLDQCIEKGIKRIWLQPGTRSEELKKKAEDHGIEVVEWCVLIALSEDV